jgi:maleylacetate reductase
MERRMPSAIKTGAINAGRVLYSRIDEVVFGKPAAAAVAEIAGRMGAQRILLMVSGTLNRETDEIEKVRQALGTTCVGTFDRVPAHTPRSAVIAATAQARDARADLIVTIGGGSITDAAKVVQLALANDVTSADGLDVFLPAKGRGNQPPSRPPTVRQIAVPTTLSGGEFSAVAGVTNEARKFKESFRHSHMVPAAIVLDPSITLRTPEWLFLSTGIRAVDHCVEGICAAEAHPFGNAQAIQGLTLLSQGLPRVKANPADLAARLDCQMGTWLSMGAISSGVPMGASHGIGYVLGSGFGVPHGHTSCIMLPAVMRWNKSVNATKQAMVAAAMGRPGDDAGDALQALIGGLGMPTRLSDVKIGRDRFDWIAEQAMSTPWVPRNPRPVSGPRQVLEILELAA